MNVQEYISSGVIESYVLGLSSPEERAEFEKNCREYPEIVAARTAFELALERQVQSTAIAPGADLKEKVMNAVRQYSPVNQTKFITMQSSTNRSSAPFKWLAAASIILLLGTAYWGYKMYSDNNELKEKNQQLASQVKTGDSIVNERDVEHKLMSDPNVAVVTMASMKKGTDDAPSTNVYWDSTKNDVYLVVKNLPKLPSEKQYQLWSIINGEGGKLQPTSLGLFDVGDNKKIILKMEGSKKADAFAITIEDRGNTGGPHLEQLQTMGKTAL